MKRKKQTWNRKGMVTVGIDLGESSSYATVITNEKSETFSFTMNEEGYQALREKIPLDARIAFESSGSAYPFDRQLRQMGYTDITVAHPKELTWIVKSKKKHDRVDSVKIGKLHSVGMIPEAHLLKREDQILRDLLLQRVKLGQEISRLKNSIIGYLKREGLYDSLPKSTNGFSALRRKTMKSIAFGDERDLVLSTMILQLELVEKLTEPLEGKIRERARVNDDVRLLMSIPGVNFYLASLLCTYIGDVNRFPDADHLASFFGIVPAERNSSSMRRVGRISRDGPSTPRWALSVMVDTVGKFKGPIHDYYAKSKARTGKGSLAHVLGMKKLVRMIYHMLKTRERWKWENESVTARKLEALESE